MVKTFGPALTALGLVGALAACSTPGANGAQSASTLGGKVDASNIGVATRAQAALEKGDTVAAIQFAERAVASSPRDASFRALLGNAYFAGGRFASAETAYKDSLTLLPNQPQLILKLALVSIAQGKNDEALAQLDAARAYLDPSDYGLALALAGQPTSAASVLEQAARAVGADARVRQNLALAYALQGDWTAAKTIAAQDVPADQLDTRIQQWMTFAKPAHASDQVAALTGITPAAADPGQPVRLALNSQDTEQAAAEPVAVPVAEPAPAIVEQAEAPASAPVEYAAAPAPAPAQVAAADPAPPAPVIAAPKPALSPRAASFSESRPLIRKASFPRAVRGNSKSVVQLGAYGSSSFVGVAWNNISKKYPALRGYTPATARFASAKGTVFRLSIQGFASDGDARNFCGALKRAGGSCFVRTVAGDAPVRLASL